MDVLETHPKNQGPAQMPETHLAIEIKGDLHLENLSGMRGTETVRIGIDLETQELAEM